MPALLFDFDGVIVHSEPLHFLAIRDAFAAVGVRFTEETYYQRYVAYADRDLFPIIAADASLTLTPSRLHDLLEDKWRRFAHLVASQGVHTFPATLDLIRAAHARGLTIALVTAAMRRDVDLILTSLNVLHHFATIVTADDVPASKPDPAPYRLACQRLGLPPSHCIALEDTPRGVASALAAGCAAIGVAHTLPARELAVATRVFESTASLTLDDMLTLLPARFPTR